MSKFIIPKAEAIFLNREHYFADKIKITEEFTNSALALRAAHQAKIAATNNHIQEMQRTALEDLEAVFISNQRELALELKSKVNKSTAEIEEAVKMFHLERKPYCIELAGFIIEKITASQPDLKLLKEIMNRQFNDA